MRNSRNLILRFLILGTILVAIAVVGLLIGLGVNGEVLLIFLALVPITVWAAKWETRYRQSRLQKAAASFGFQLVDPSDVRLTIYPLRGSGWVLAAVSRQMQGLKAWIFDYTIRDPSLGHPPKNVSQTVVAFRVEDANLPIFQIRPLRSTSILDSDWKSYEGNWESSDDTICFHRKGSEIAATLFSSEKHQTPLAQKQVNSK